MNDLLGPWRGNGATLTLREEEYARLLRDLDESGAYRSPDETLTLAARNYYWVAASCHEGKFHLTAWLYPSPAFEQLTFPTWLTALDRTGIPFNPPRRWTEQSSNRYASTGLEFGSAGTATRGIRPPASWAIGIAQDRLVDRLEF